ncbi:MAG: hypothetical protein L0312_10960 [Acidobacteria bacterium]|nr:hypothetical protein [Acidobacteriota bacterium]
MKARRSTLRLSFCLLLLGAVLYLLDFPIAAEHSSYLPGERVLLDAHNCYPEHGQWTDRLERALKAGLPLAVEQDLVWYTNKGTGRSWSIVAHNAPYVGDEPTLKNYFFERIRPIVEAALSEGSRRHWPLITLNLDFKSEERAHLAAIWSLLGEYESWLCTAERGPDLQKSNPLALKPVLVLTGSSDTQQKIFHDDAPPGTQLRLFGAVKLQEGSDPLEERVPPSNNYRRWWNNPWSFVEEEGQRKPGDWTAADRERLNALVRQAHVKGLWIRFYTLNGHATGSSPGWTESYNFGSEEGVRLRWKAAIEAGVDFVATDQYELFAELKSKYK